MYEINDERFDSKKSAKDMFPVNCEAPIRGLRAAIDDLITTADRCVVHLRDIHVFFVGVYDEKCNAKDVHDSDLANSFGSFREELYGTLSIVSTANTISDRILDTLLIRSNCVEANQCEASEETNTNSPIESVLGGIAFETGILTKRANEIFKVLFGNNDPHIINIPNESVLPPEEYTVGLNMEGPMLEDINRLCDGLGAICALLNEVQKRL